MMYIRLKLPPSLIHLDHHHLYTTTTPSYSLPHPHYYNLTFPTPTLLHHHHHYYHYPTLPYPTTTPPSPHLPLPHHFYTQTCSYASVATVSITRPASLCFPVNLAQAHTDTVASSRYTHNVNKDANDSMPMKPREPPMM